MGGAAVDPSSLPDDFEYEPWYKWGVRVLYLEMLIAIGVTLFSLYTALSGSGGLGGH